MLERKLTIYFFASSNSGNELNENEEKSMDHCESSVALQRRSDSSPRCSESDSSFCSKNSLDSCQDTSVFHQQPGSLSGDNFSPCECNQGFEYKRQGSDSSVASGSGNSSPLLSSAHSANEESSKPCLTSTPNQAQNNCIKKVFSKSGLALAPSQERSLSKSPEMGSLQSIKKSRSMSADSPLVQNSNGCDPALERSLSNEKKSETTCESVKQSPKAQLDVPPPPTVRRISPRLSHSFSHKHYRRLSSCSSVNSLSSSSSKTLDSAMFASKSQASPSSGFHGESNEAIRFTASKVAKHKVSAMT